MQVQVGLLLFAIPVVASRQAPLSATNMQLQPPRQPLWLQSQQRRHEASRLFEEPSRLRPSTLHWWHLHKTTKPGGVTRAHACHGSCMIGQSEHMKQWHACGRWRATDAAAQSLAVPRCTLLTALSSPTSTACQSRQGLRQDRK